MSTRPARKDVNFIQGDKLAYSFTFTEDDNAVDLTAKDNVTVVLKNQNSTAFSHSVTGGELTISGAGNNKITGEASSTVMDIARRGWDLLVFYNDDPDKETQVMFDVTIFNELDELQSSASEWTINFDTQTGTATAQASQVLTASDIKTLYESNADTNAFTDDEKSKVGAYDEYFYRVDYDFANGQKVVLYQQNDEASLTNQTTSGFTLSPALYNVNFDDKDTIVSGIAQDGNWEGFPPNISLDSGKIRVKPDLSGAAAIDACTIIIQVKKLSSDMIEI